jgi:hypothetical protein
MRIIDQQQSASQTDFGQLPPRLRERLAKAGVTTACDWLALGERRYAIFGVTRSMAEAIDALAQV